MDDRAERADEPAEPADAPAKWADDRAELAAVFKALGDPNRLAIFELIRAAEGHGRSAQEAGNSISRIAGRFDLTLSTVSHHIKELRAAGLVRCQRQGQTVYCSADRDMLARAARFLAGEGG